MCECAKGYGKPLSRLPLPDVQEGDDGSCLEALAAADNAAWNTYQAAIANCLPADPNCPECLPIQCLNLAGSQYLLDRAKAVYDYYMCMFFVPP